MKAYPATFPLAAMCRVLGLSPSGYYGWLNRPPSARAGRDSELKVRIKAIWRDSDETYGCPRIHAALVAGGERVSRKRVARLMRELDIEGVTRRRLKTGHDEEGRQGRARAGPGEPELLGQGSRPAVGGGHHVRTREMWQQDARRGKGQQSARRDRKNQRWSCKRRVVAKAEHLADKANPRFVVTSLPTDTFSARIVYERLYCARGNMENTIKEQ